MSRSPSGWKNWGDHPVVVVIVVIAAIIGVAAAVITITGYFNKQIEAQDNPSSHEDFGVPPAPPDIAGPILREEDLIPGGYDTCAPNDSFYTVTVIRAGQNQLWETDMPIFFLKDARGVVDDYAIDKEGIEKVAASWIPVIMVPGRRLKIKYMTCGSGGFMYLTYIEPLPAKKKK